MATYLDNNSIRAFFDIAKGNVYYEGGRVHWKRLEFDNNLPPAFHLLSEQNKNRILYYGATVHKFNQAPRSIENIIEVLDLDTNYDTSTFENVLILYSKFFTLGENRTPSPLLLGDMLRDLTKSDMFTAFDMLMKQGLEHNHTSSTSYINIFLSYAGLLLINTQYDGETKIFNSLIKSENELPFNDFISRIFAKSMLPEPTFDYFSKN